MGIAIIGFLLGVTLVVAGTIGFSLDSTAATDDAAQISAWLLGGGALLTVGTTIGYLRHRLRNAESVPEQLVSRADHRHRTPRPGQAGEQERVSVDSDRFASEISALPSLSARMEMRRDRSSARETLLLALPLTAVGGFFVFIASFLAKDEELRPIGIMLGTVCVATILYVLWRAWGGHVRFTRPRRARLNWTHGLPLGRALLIGDSQGRVARLGPEYLTVPDLLEVHRMPFRRLVSCVMTRDLGPILDAVAPRQSARRAQVFEVLYRRIADPDEMRGVLATLLAYPQRAHLAPLERARDAILRASDRVRIQETMDEIERRLTELVGAVSLDEEADRGQVSLAREGAQLSVVDSDD